MKAWECGSHLDFQSLRGDHESVAMAEFVGSRGYNVIVTARIQNVTWGRNMDDFITSLIFWAIGLFFAALLALGIFTLFDYSQGTTKASVGTVFQRSYVPESSSTSVGPVVGGSNNGGVAITTTTTSEKWVVLMTSPDFDDLVKLEVKSKMYMRIKDGSIIDFDYTVGKYSGHAYQPDSFTLRE